jgi:integrase
MLQEGVHPAIASAVLGHSSPAFTMRVYQHVTDGMTEQAAAALERALGGR